MIRTAVDEDALKKIEKELGNLSSKAPSVMKKALNETAKEAKKELAVKAKATYTAKNVAFNSEMKIKSATVGNREAVISAFGEPIPLIRFKVSAGKKATKAQVLKEGTLKELKSNSDGNDIKAFVNNIARKGQVRAKDTEKGKAGTAVIHKAVAIREGKERLGIHEKYSVPIPIMLGGERVFGSTQEEIVEKLRKNLRKHIEKILEKNYGST